jgi:hypothetical protein
MSKLFNIFFIFLTFILISGCVSDERSVEDIANSGNNFFLQNDFSSALDEYSILIDKINKEGILLDDYEMSSIYLMTGICNHNLENYDVAVKDYSKAINLDPKNVEAYVARAQAYSSLGKDSLMSEDIKRAIDLGFEYNEQDFISPEKESSLSELNNNNDNNDNNDNDNELGLINNERNYYDTLVKIPSLNYKKEFDSLTLSSQSKNSASEIIDLAIVKRITDDELSIIADRKDLIADYELTGLAYEIDAEHLSDSEKADLKDKLYITFKIPSDYLSLVEPDNVGAIYYSPKGTIFMDGALSSDGSSVIIPTSHLSLYELVFGKPTKKAEDIIKAEAKKYAYSAGSYVENQIIEGIKNNQFLLGIDDDMKSKVLNNVMSNKDKIAELAAIAGGDDSVDAGKSISLLVGKLIVDNMDEDDLKKAFGGSILKGLVDKADLVGELADAVGKEDYLAAVEAIGKNIANELMIVKATKAGAAAWDAAIKAWEDGKNEQLYQEWLKEDGSSDFWEDSYNQNGYSALYRQYAIKDPKCLGDSSRSCVEKLFKERKKKEELISKEEQKLKNLYEIFQKDNYVFLRGDLEKQLKLNVGDSSVSNTMLFEFFIKNMKQIEVELKSLGIEEPAWNKYGLSSDASKLLIAYSEGGKDAKLKAFKELQLREAKKLKFKKCIRDSDCENGYCSEEYICVDCIQDEHCDMNFRCIENKCENVEITVDSTLQYGIYKAIRSDITASVLHLNCPYNYDGKQRVDFDGFFRTNDNKVTFKSTEFDLTKNSLSSGEADLEYDCTSYYEEGFGEFRECQYDKGTYSVSVNKNIIKVSYSFFETEISGSINLTYDASLGCN